MIEAWPLSTPETESRNMYLCRIATFNESDFYRSVEYNCNARSLSTWPRTRFSAFPEKLTKRLSTNVTSTPPTISIGEPCANRSDLLYFHNKASPPPRSHKARSGSLTVGIGFAMGTWTATISKVITLFNVIHAKRINIG